MCDKHALLGIPYMSEHILNAVHSELPCRYTVEVSIMYICRLYETDAKQIKGGSYMRFACAALTVFLRFRGI